MLIYPSAMPNGEEYSRPKRDLTPAAYADLSVPGMQRDGTLRYIAGSAPRPVASPSHQGSNDVRTLLIGG